MVLNEFFYSGRRLPSLISMKGTQGYVRIYNIIISIFLHRTVSRRKWEHLKIKESPGRK